MYRFCCMALKPVHASALDFVINRFVTKLFKTTDIDIVVKCYQNTFRFELPSVRLSRLKRDF